MVEMDDPKHRFQYVPDSKSVTQHRNWLGQYGTCHLKQWDDMLQVDPEAAMSEAMVRELLVANDNIVAPNTDVNNKGKSPDFICRQNGRIFYVEVTCISIASATEKTGLEHNLVLGKAQNYALLNDVIFAECCKKTPQCAGLDYPCLLAICTHHRHVSSICFQEDHLSGLLTGEPLININVDLRNGRVVGEPYETTRLRSATFIKSKDGQATWWRLPISGILVCGFGCDPPAILGVLHPEPNYPFDPAFLPSVRMGQVTLDRETGNLEVRWPDEGRLEQRPFSQGA